MDSLFFVPRWRVFALLIGVLCCYSGGWGQGLTATPNDTVCQLQINAITISTSSTITSANNITSNPSNGLIFNFPNPPFSSFSVDVTNSMPGSYNVIYTKPNNQTESVQITIGSPLSSTFFYGKDRYCISEVSATPTIIDSGGTFFSLGTVFTAFNSSSGIIDLAGSNPNPDSLHYIGYITSNQVCSDTTLDSLYITDYSSDFIIDGGNNGNCFTPGDFVTLTGINGPGILTYIDGTTTLATVPNLTAPYDSILSLPIPSPIQVGTDSIKYTLQNSLSGCDGVDTDPIHIGLPNSTLPSYSGDFFCQNNTDTISFDANPTPPPCNNCETWIASPSGLNINTSNGSFIPANAAPGIYAITYTYNHLSGCSDSYFVDSIEIRPTIQASISYPDTFCRSNNNLILSTANPTPIGGSLGFPTGFDSTGNYAFDIVTLSPHIGDSTFQFTYEFPDSSCVLPDTHQLVIRELFGSFHYVDTSLCASDGIELALSNHLPSTATVNYFNSSPISNTLIIDPGTGTITPLNSDSGSYTIGAELTLGTCTETFFADQEVYIWPDPSPGFNLDSVYCTFGNNFQIIPDTAGGIFSLVTPSVGLNITPSGYINLIASDPNIYTIKYSLDPLDCPIERYQNFTILDTVFSDFIYPTNPVCEDQVGMHFGVAGPGSFSGGNYFVTDTAAPNLVADSITGLLDPTGLNGTYRIYRLLDTLCADSASFVITINDGTSEFFSYEKEEYCSSDDSAVVDTSSLENILGTYSYWGSDTLVWDTLTGTIDLQASDKTSFDLVFFPAGNGYCPDSQKTTISIFQEDTWTEFEYPGDTICLGGPALIPDFTFVSNDTSGYFFSNTPNLFLDLNTGVINLDSSFTGTAQIGYHLTGACKDTFYTSVEINPLDSVSLAFLGNDTNFCGFELPIYPTAFGGSPGKFTITTNWFNIDSILGTISFETVNYGRSDPIVTYTTDQLCPNSASQIIVVDNPPLQPQVNIKPDSIVCLGDTIIVETNSTAPKIFYLDGDTLDIHAQSISLVLSPGLYMLEIVYDPDTECGERFMSQLQVNPIPLLSTPIDSFMTLSTDDPLDIPFTSSVDSTRIHFWTDTLGPVWAEPGTDSTEWSARDSTLQVDLSFYTSNELVSGTVIFFAQPISRACKGDITKITFDINPGIHPIYVPEVLSPNGDQINDTWVIQWNSEITPEDYTMHVFNASHGKVHQFPIQQGWRPETDPNSSSGIANGPNVPDGVYWWLLKDRKQVVVQSGGLTIRRIRPN